MSSLREKMISIGPNVLLFFEGYINSSLNRKYNYRSISWILTLRKIYSDQRIDDACKRALSYGAYSYKRFIRTR
ncbi:hypothetical protein [Clostridium felsineum]|uniref:hypothetical protein n=1 Tax=Clostridium felsineum TaxID=36839 RepID=UPI001591AB6C|nr:hypothetical protein [Clostridium felsineum]